MFGSSAGASTLGTQNKPTFLFGSASNTAASTGPTSSGSGFLFGAPKSASVSAALGTGQSGGLFGSAAPANTATSGGLFGASSGTANTTGGGLFGKPNAAPAAPATGNTSLFGGASGGTNTNTANTGFNTGLTTLGLFGNNQNQNTQNTGTTSGGLFGNAQTTQPQSSGLFGNTQSTQPLGSGLFGGQTTQSSGLFGAKPAAPATNTTGGLFGAKPAGGLFGLTQNQTQPLLGLFGQQQTQPQTQGSGLFGSQNTAATNTNAAQSAPVNATAPGAQPAFSWSGNQKQSVPLQSLQLSLAAKSQPPGYTPTINDQIAQLKEKWDPLSGKCVFETHLYNKYSEAEIAQLLQQPRPANESPEEWEKAMAARPSPLRFPVKVALFDEIAQRVEVQLAHVAKLRVLLNNINDQSTQLASQRDLDTQTRLAEAQARHTALLRRLLKLASLLAVLKLKGYPLLPEEEELSRQFEALNARISDPCGSVGKLGDLYARLAILKGRSEEVLARLATSIKIMDGDLNEGAKTEEVVQLLTKLLYKQQVGLNYLNDVLQQDTLKLERK